MAKLQVYKRVDGLFDYRLLGDNGETLCSSDQGYTSRTDAHRGVHAMASAIVKLITPAGVLTEDLDDPGHDMQAKPIPTDAETAEDEGL